MNGKAVNELKRLIHCCVYFEEDTLEGTRAEWLPPYDYVGDGFVKTMQMTV